MKTQAFLNNLGTAVVYAMIGAFPGIFVWSLFALAAWDEERTLDPHHQWDLIAIIVIGAIVAPAANWFRGREQVTCTSCGWKGHRRDVPWASTGMSDVSYCPHCGTYGITNP